MAELKIFADSDPETLLQHSRDKSEMAAILAGAGIRYEQWQAGEDIAAGAASEAVMKAYSVDIARLQREEGYQTVDVISLHPQHPDREALRKKFLDEHRHTEDEVRFFVDGQGLFTLHLNGKIYQVLCSRGDLISVPANTPHWFDMGSQPSFVAIRFFNNPDGWVAHYTGSEIAQRYSRLP